jgi:hypothetical protein
MFALRASTRRSSAAAAGWPAGLVVKVPLYLASVTASDWVNSYVPYISVQRMVSTVVAIIDEPDTRPE